MVKAIRTRDLFDTSGSFTEDLFTKYEYPWQILPNINAFIRQIIERGLNGYTVLKPGVLIGRNTKISNSAEINEPTIIGHNTELRQGAFIRGSVIISDGCVIGNSCEIKSSIILDETQIPHFNYVGDSILGRGAHLGAGTVCSNLKADGRAVVIHADEDYETGLRKVGGFVADGADIGCGCVINPGCIIGRRTSVYPLVSLRGVYPADCIVKSASQVTKRI